MTAAWDYYVNSNQFLTELQGMTRNYPFNGDIVAEAQRRVRSDPDSNRSWNLAWLCLMKIRDEYVDPWSTVCSRQQMLISLNSNLIPAFAAADAARPEMWGGRDPEADEASQLAACFEYEWTMAVDTMLRHWSIAPTWY